MTKLFGANQFDSVEFKLGRYDRFYIGPSRNTWFRWETTGLQLNATSANTVFRFGAAGAGLDVFLLGDTSGRDAQWDQSRDALNFRDNAALGIGGAADAAADVAIAWDATRLNVTPAAVNTVWRFGSATATMDVEFYSDVAASLVTWDASADTMIFAGNSTASAAPRLRIMTDLRLPGTRVRGDTFLISNTTGLYLAVMTAPTTVTGTILGTALPT